MSRWPASSSSTLGRKPRESLECAISPLNLQLLGALRPLSSLPSPYLLESIDLTGCGGLRERLRHVVREYGIDRIEFTSAYPQPQHTTGRGFVLV